MAKESLAGNSSDNAYLYLLFTAQVFVMGGVMIHFLYTVCNAERSSKANPRHKLYQVIFMLFLTKWIMDVYDLTHQDVANNLSSKFDPYRLLHINNDASFDTKAVKQAYRRLSVKYHPDKVDKSKISPEAANRRYQRLVLAYQTLTKKKMYDNWMKFGDPKGSQATQAMGLAIPTWMFDEEWRVQLFMGLGLLVVGGSLYFY